MVSTVYGSPINLIAKIFIFDRRIFDRGSDLFASLFAIQISVYDSQMSSMNVIFWVSIIALQQILNVLFL